MSTASLNVLVNFRMSSSMVHVVHTYLMMSSVLCFVLRRQNKTHVSGIVYTLVSNCIVNCNILVIMVKNIPTIPIQPILILGPHLGISTITFLSLVVDIQLATIMLNSSISNQIHGRQKLHFHSAQLESEFTSSLALHKKTSTSVYRAR